MASESIVSDPHEYLRNDVRMLGAMLGDAFREREGTEFFDRVESVRALAKEARGASVADASRLRELLSGLTSGEAHLLARAFSHFLNLANIAEQHHRVRRNRQASIAREAGSQPGGFRGALAALIEGGIQPAALRDAVLDQQVELVFTAHPTEVDRRSLLRKKSRIAGALNRLDRTDLSPPERRETLDMLRREVIAFWNTQEIRKDKPTPQAEARAGLLVFEQTLWDEVPRVLRELDGALLECCGEGLPWDCAPLRFGSWMGGDRDGNPNVTPQVTREAIFNARWMAAALYAAEIEALYSELSVDHCSEELRARVGSAEMPYRVVLRELRHGMTATIAYLDAARDGRPASSQGVYASAGELTEPLLLLRRSLEETGLSFLAGGRLLDLLRRLSCFGLSLARLDIRQEASRHTEALDAVTRALGLGSYAAWNEQERQQFLLRELNSQRPLIPRNFEADPEVMNVLGTFAVIAETGPEFLGAYVISMAETASDVLAVELLQHASGVAAPLRVVPLFENTKALRDCGETLAQLLSLEWYRNRIGGRQEVMLGYSDSTKEASRLTSAWMLYRAQETMTDVCARAGVRLSLFHGRGGTVSRGGGTVRQAVLSLPPGSVSGRLRVTEQGEMIQANFGLPGLANSHLEQHLTSTLGAALLPGESPLPQWRELMERLAEVSMASYRRVLDQPEFVAYFRAVTPEQELGHLNVGSRPSRRAAEGGLETLRAIPWVFAWTQVRLMLPAWLGLGDALEWAMGEGKGDLLRAMYREWPFFQSTIDLIEMVLAKADAGVFAHYNDVLADGAMSEMGKSLLQRLEKTVALVLEVTGHERLLQDNEMLLRSIEVRNPYVDPINLLQVELLRRVRGGDATEETLTALLTSIRGVVAGMRNTG